MSSDNTKIIAMLILDIVGRPKEHLLETLEKIIGEMDKEKGVIIKSKEIKEPTLMKDQKEFYTTFAEIEVEVEDILYLAILMFKYMPAHVEIISPEIIALSNNGFNDIFNELIRRLHGYDEFARVMQIEKQTLLKKIKELGGEKKPREKKFKTKKSKKNKTTFSAQS